ncbi:MAG: glycosyl hydrolase [Candidatus Saccharibacteria bacterium]|nr:glycosyl hydrolase [Candidatus Saccharibacteria bacterium]
MVERNLPQSERQNRLSGVRLMAVIGSIGLTCLLATCIEAPSTQATCATQEVAETFQTPETLSLENSGEFSAKPSWEQDFSQLPDGPIDSRVWRYELDADVPTYNNEAAAYTDSTKNVRIENGNLILEACRESYRYSQSSKEYAFTSGRIDTKDSLTFAYGKLEATMKLPEGAGTWPAFWLLSANEPNTQQVTDSNLNQDRLYMKDGEIDIMEAYGHTPGVVEATLHTYLESHDSKVTLSDASHAFHTYGIEITPTRLVWTIDGQPYYSFDKPSDNLDEWPIDGKNQFYAILNLAMGGSGGQEIDSSLNEARLEVQSVKFYDYVKD